MRRLSGRRLPLVLALSGLPALAACSGDTNWVRDAAVWSGVGAERKPAPEFVVQSRTTNLDYVPVGVAPPKRDVEAKPQSAVKAAETEMDTIRTTNEGRGSEARQFGAATPAAKPPVLPPPIRQ
jgi:hypothetical protein